MFGCIALWFSFKGLICVYDCVLFRFPPEPSLVKIDLGLESLHGCLGLQGPVLSTFLGSSSMPLAEALASAV